MEEELWRDVVGWEGWYQVSNLGRVKRIKITGGTNIRIMSPSPVHGYPSLSLCADRYPNASGYAKVYVHTLVAEAFLGPRPEGCHIHHKDGDRANAHIDNLEYKPVWKHVGDHRRTADEKRLALELESR